MFNESQNNIALRKPVYNWYVIYTKANAEKKLCANLLEKKIECYLPLRKELKHWSDRKKWVEEPLFRGYVFVRVSYKEFFDALNTQGAVNFVSFGGQAQAIPDVQINNIRKFVEQTEQEVTLTYKRIKKGVKAEVIYGSLKGVQGEVIQIFGQSRILIRIETMKCCLYANVSNDEIKILQGPESLKKNKLI
ncbi:Transcriptional activator RfaH [hydrothermal vent metagenome]|uniref:Transcriptional activator RfaH n=1 Tax=hydrothermal vent metagenome TaxID=652676 RepID=A0A3B0U6W3_9ZZZZ